MTTESKKIPDAAPPDPDRRQFFTQAVAAGLGGGLSLGLASCAKQAPATAAESAADGHVKPGQLDEYYGLWSGGHTGDVRVLGLPSGRELHRIPVFVPDALIGWGITNESKKIMGTRPDGSLKYTVGDTHHVHGSYENGTYDGKYAWVNDKINSRLGRIRLDTMECDRILELPNVQGFHGIFPDKRDPVDESVNRTTRVFCGGEFHIPVPNDGREVDDAGKYRTLFTCVDAESMEPRWQVLIDGNCDLVASSFDGKLAASNQYNTEGGAKYEEMMAVERDACIFFNIARIEQAVRDGRSKTYGASKVPVVDGTREANKDPRTALTAYVAVPKNPHGVNATPDGKYFICSGKLSPTASVIDLAAMLQWFDGNLADIQQAIVAEVELGLGPLHTVFDGRGNAFTTLFLDSQVVKWNVDKAIQFFKGDKSATYVVDRLDLHYQPGHLNATMAETREADGKYLSVGCKFSKDRFLPVGPLHPENEQIIDISGEKMRLLHEAPVRPEPHDFIIVRRDRIRTRQVYDQAEFPNAIKDMNEARVERNGRKVTVYLPAVAPAFGLREIKLKRGDEVTLICTNFDKVEDLGHGVAIPRFNINFTVHPGETKSVTFVADQPGVSWLYCTHFCHPLHLEMRTRLMVEA